LPDHRSRTQNPFKVFHAGVLPHQVTVVVDTGGGKVVDAKEPGSTERGGSVFSTSGFFSIWITRMSIGVQTGSAEVVGWNSISGCVGGG